MKTISYNIFLNTSTGKFNNEDITTGNIINESTGNISNAGYFYIKSNDTLTNYGTITSSNIFRFLGPFTNYGKFTNTGTVNGSDDAIGTITNKSSGEIDNGNTGYFRIREGSTNSINYGTINISGSITNHGLKIDSGADLTNKGTINIKEGTSISTNNGTIYINGGIGLLNISSGCSLKNTGTIKYGSSLSVCGLGQITGTVTNTGAGTVSNACPP
jgi:hypothetical protein